MTNLQMLYISFDKCLVHIDCLLSQCTLSVMCIFLKHSSNLDTLSFFYKNIFYKNIGWNSRNFKNIFKNKAEAEILKREDNFACWNICKWNKIYVFNLTV